MKTLLDRIKDRVDVEPHQDGCWIWKQGRNGAGAPQISIRAISPVPILVRRLVYTIAIGAVPANRVVGCRCGETSCVSPSHLVLRSKSEVGAETLQQVNAKTTTAQRRAAQVKRRDAGSFKLNPQAVAEIRRMLADGSDAGKVAAAFAVSRHTIVQIRNGRRWAGDPVATWHP